MTDCIDRLWPLCFSICADFRLIPTGFHLISITLTARLNRPTKLYRADPSDLPLQRYVGPFRPPSGATFGPKSLQLGRPDPLRPFKNHAFLKVFHTFQEIATL